MARIERSWQSTALALLFLAMPAGGADLVEPWEPGLSDVEFYTTWEEGGARSGSTLVGFGLDGGLSVGLSLTGGSEPADVGLVFVWSRAIGRFGDLDLFAEAAAAAHEVELDELGQSYGLEWSAPLAAGRRPYLRLTAVEHDDGFHWHPLLGLNVALRGIDLHLELSAEQPDPGSDWPLHVAVGPNFDLGTFARRFAGVELLPELSLLYDPGSGELQPALTLGIVTSPQALGSVVGIAGR